MIPAALTLANVTAGYGGRGEPVVRGVSAGPFEPGRVVALIGPNGAGKSTLLRALAGLVQMTGSVRLGSRELTASSRVERSSLVGFMPQSFARTGSLGVLESVIGAIRASPLAGGNLGGAAARARALATLERIGIVELGLVPLGRLSGGQRQLAGLAAAIVRGPALLLLDEPTSALDLRHQFEVMRLVRDLAREGRVVVLVLHDLGLAARFADTLVLLHRGTVHGAGPASDVLTPDALAAVYGVAARIESDGGPGLRIHVEDPVAPAAWHTSTAAGTGKGRAWRG